jgi:hypothetical protein
VRSEAVVRLRILEDSTILGRVNRDIVSCSPNALPALQVARDALIADLQMLSREVRAMRDAYILVRGR